MTITVPAVYEGDGVLKLERPVALKEKAKVNVIIEAAPEALTEDQDPTGWKTADRFDSSGCGRVELPVGRWAPNTTRTSASDIRRHELPLPDLLLTTNHVVGETITLAVVASLWLRVGPSRVLPGAHGSTPRAGPQWWPWPTAGPARRCALRGQARLSL